MPQPGPLRWPRPVCRGRHSSWLPETHGPLPLETRSLCPSGSPILLGSREEVFCFPMNSPADVYCLTSGARSEKRVTRHFHCRADITETATHTQWNDVPHTWARRDSPALRGHQPGRRVTAPNAVGDRDTVGSGRASRHRAGAGKHGTRIKTPPARALPAHGARRTGGRRGGSRGVGVD